MNPRRLTPICLSLTLAVTAACSAAPGGPNIQTAGNENGIANCAVLDDIVTGGYIGIDQAQPKTAMDEDFHTPPSDQWCNTSVGYSSLDFGDEGVRLTVPRSKEAQFPYNNAEMLARPIFGAGMTMTDKIKGTDLTSHNGTFGFGISNRTLNIGELEIAWFMYNNSTSFLSDVTVGLGPVFNALGMDPPQGFFVMVKRAGWPVPQVQLIDENLLKGDHSYAVELDTGKVRFYVDGELVADLGNPPAGQGKDDFGRSLPLIGQIWLDSGYWLPYPIPQWNGTTASAVLERYVQGPSQQTPLTLP